MLALRKNGPSLLGEINVLGVLFVLFVTFLVLVVLLWVGTLWFQGYIYSEPAPQLSWRAPAAAGALTVLLGLWCYLAARGWGGEGTLFDFGATDSKEFDRFTAVYGQVVPLTGEPVKPDVKLNDRLVLKSPREVSYVRRRVGNHYEYVGPDGKAWVRSGSNGICAQIRFKQGDQEIVFQPELETVKDTGGKERVQFKIGKVSQPGVGLEATQSLRYVEVGGRGRVMTEDNLGWLGEFRWGAYFVNLLLNVLHLAVWFVCLWLLLRFQWAHALGLAFVFWLVMTLAVLPPILSSARAAAQPAASPAQTGLHPSERAVRKPFHGSRVSGVQWTLRVQVRTS
jgi:hypothetical protein